MAQLENDSANMFIVKIFQEQRVECLEVHQEVWFKARQVAEILEYKNEQQAIRKNVDPQDRTTLSELQGMLLESTPLKSNEQGQTVMVNETGLYSLVLRSRKPEAKKFKRWVTSEVLPSIRKTGQYRTESRINQLEKTIDWFADHCMDSAPYQQQLPPKRMKYIPKSKEEKLKIIKKDLEQAGIVAPIVAWWE
jgi:prophage antirepressor-like protein